MSTDPKTAIPSAPKPAQDWGHPTPRTPLTSPEFVPGVRNHSVDTPPGASPTGGKTL